MMKTPLVSRSGAPASPLCFGTMQFGGSADSAASRGMYDASRAAGVNFFDTAHRYTDGRSEELLGTFAAAERDDVILATKADFSQGSTRENIMRSFEESCTRLGTDFIDLYHMHRWDDGTPIDETIGAFASLKQDGRIGWVGISNFTAWQAMKAQWVASTLWIQIDVFQPMYNLVKRQAEVEIIPACMAEGIGVVPYSPLGGGLLTGKYAAGKAGRLTEDARYRKRHAVSWMHEAAAALPNLAAVHGTTAATLAVAWVAKNEGVTAPIISAKSAEQLAPSLAALSFEMSDALCHEITELTPSPTPATDRIDDF